MVWLAGLTALAGLGIAAIALASTVGVWFGLWDFRTGFSLLRFAHGHADWIAATGLVVTLGLLTLNRVLNTGNGLRVGGLALTGTLAAALGYYIPESFRPPDDANIPPIHDVSTDTVDPPDYVAILPLRADAPNTTEYGGSPGMTRERLAQLQTQAYPDVRTLVLDEQPEHVFEQALAAVSALGWDVVAAVPEAGRIEATDTTFWFRFKDDVVVRIRPGDNGGTVVDARSVSRVGGGDAGTNARRLRAFLEQLRAESRTR
jgi:uncharacterized protein (DUF1499 family)